MPSALPPRSPPNSKILVPPMLLLKYGARLMFYRLRLYRKAVVYPDIRGSMCRPFMIGPG